MGKACRRQVETFVSVTALVSSFPVFEGVENDIADPERNHGKSQQPTEVSACKRRKSPYTADGEKKHAQQSEGVGRDAGKPSVLLDKAEGWECHQQRENSQSLPRF